MIVSFLGARSRCTNGMTSLLVQSSNVIKQAVKYLLQQDSEYVYLLSCVRKESFFNQYIASSPVPPDKLSCEPSMK